MKKLDGISDMQVLTVETDWGWIAAVGRYRVLHFLSIGRSDAQNAIKACGADSVTNLPEPASWHPRLEKLLRAYAHGKQVDFSEVEIDESHLTSFQRKIVSCCRKIPYGKTLSYGELAAQAGSPNAARAVGTVMAKNRFPLVVPCHRVLAAGGKLGGFSAPSGTSLKKRLLELEAKSSQISKTRR